MATLRQPRPAIPHSSTFWERPTADPRPIRARRKRIGVSAYRLAHAAGFSPYVLVRAECGQRVLFKDEADHLNSVLEQLERAFGVKPADRAVRP